MANEFCQQNITVKMLHSNLLWTFWGSKVQLIIAVSDITTSNLFFTIFYTSFFWTQFTSVQLEEFTNLRPVQEKAEHYANNDDCITPTFNIFFLASKHAMEVAVDDSSTNNTVL